MSEGMLDEWRERLRQFRGWLAVLCVQKVLPILLDADPQDQSIFDELSASIAFLKGEPSPHDLHRLLDRSYHGHWLSLLDFYDGLPPQNALAVLMASFKAMQEVKFWQLDTGWLDPLAHSGAPDGNAPDPTDEDFVGQAGAGDAAGAAAVAWACRADATEGDPARLQAFWTWYLNEAWIMASHLAQRYAAHDQREVPPIEKPPEVYADPPSEPCDADGWPDEQH